MNENIDVNVKTLKPFTKLLMTIGELPTSYLMSMTYYEQIIWFTKYLQEQVIPAVNTNAEAVEEVQTLYLELQNYVNTYFDNLDVQEEINKKLDEMAEDGTLELIIASYLNTQKIYNTHEEMIADVSNLVNGLKVQTLGYHNLNDGGGAFYLITDTESLTEYQESIGSLYATLIVTDNTINVKQLGAYGDNYNEDTTAIQNCLNNFKNIFFPRGTYLITDLSLTSKSNLNIYGENANNTMLKCIKITEEAFNVVGFNTCENIKFHDLYVHGEKTYSNTPLSFVDCNDVEVYNCIFNGGTNQRTLNVQTFSDSYGYNTNIHDNQFYNYGNIRDGALIECTGSHETIDDEEVRHYLYNLIIKNNLCKVTEGTYIGNSDLFDCIEIDNTISCIIEGNYCDNLFHIGISVDTVNIDFRVTNNYCINCITHGINVSGAYGLTQGIISNNIIKDTRQGIGVNNENISITNNQIYNSSVRGIVVLELAKYCIISNNLIDTAPEGIYVSGLVSDSLISDNKFRNISGTNKAITIADGTGNHLSLNFDNNDVTITSISRMQSINGILIGRQPSTINTLYTTGTGHLRFKDINNAVKQIDTTDIL